MKPVAPYMTKSKGRALVARAAAMLMGRRLVFLTRVKQRHNAPLKRNLSMCM